MEVFYEDDNGKRGNGDSQQLLSKRCCHLIGRANQHLTVFHLHSPPLRCRLERPARLLPGTEEKAPVGQEEPCDFLRCILGCPSCLRLHPPLETC